MSYEYSAKKINERYENIINNDIKKLKNNYQNAINKLEKIKGIDDCEQIKKDIISKKNALDDKVTEIKKIETNLLQAARKKDAQEKAKAEEEKRKGELI